MTAAEREAIKPMPPAWVSITLLGWGSLADALPSAIVMAIMLEAIRYSPVKWAMAEKEFHRAADLTSVLFAVMAAIQFSRYSFHGIYEILAVTPYCFFPLLLAQRASTRQTVPMSALFYGLRRYPEHDEPLDIAPHYVIVCLLAASTAEPYGYAFIGFTSAIIIGLLAAGRPKRYRLWQWTVALCLGLLVAGATQYGVLRAQGALENSFAYWFSQFPWSSGNPNRAITAIGAIGRLKLSDQIRVRVTPSATLEIPLTLQEASYDTFNFGTWTASEAKFEALDKVGGRDAWVTSEQPSSAAANYDISIQHRRELTMLPVPRGTRQIIAAEIAELQRNRFGNLLAESPPGALRFKAQAGRPRSLEPPPTERDLVVPDAYTKVMNSVSQEIATDPREPLSSAMNIKAFFLDNFSYSLVQRGSFGRRTPLAHFLTETRRGHCEYFASAAVLLLRTAGIPARYAVGYVVEEYSDLEGSYIARARHAHAWALAFVNNEWIVIDATPGVWFDLENDIVSRWQTVQDLGSWVRYRFQRLTQMDFSELSDLLIWLVPPLAVVLYFRLRKSPLAVADELDAKVESIERNNPIMANLLARFSAQGIVPQPGETLDKFLRRASPKRAEDTELDELIRHYYRQRFGPDDSDADARHALVERVRRYANSLFTRAR